MAQLGGKCVVCGTADSLEFDHIDPKTKIREIGKLWQARKSLFESEVMKCQLLCSAHHIEKTLAEGSSAHPTLPIAHGTVWAYQGRGCRCDRCKGAKRGSRRKRTTG